MTIAVSIRVHTPETGRPISPCACLHNSLQLYTLIDVKTEPQFSPEGGSTVTNALTLLPTIVLVEGLSAARLIFIPYVAGSVTGSDPGLTLRGSSTYWIWVTMVMALLPELGVRTKL